MATPRGYNSDQLPSPVAPLVPRLPSKIPKGYWNRPETMGLVVINGDQMGILLYGSIWFYMDIIW